MVILLMVIDVYSIGRYWCLLMIIGGYYIDGYWWILYRGYWWLLMVFKIYGY
jgi:hypothetical protein